MQEVTLYQLLEENAERFPAVEALVCPASGMRLTWKDFLHEVDSYARGLMALGVQKGEKIAIWSTNVPEWIILMFAAARIGAVLVTINTNLRVPELRFILADSECSNLCTIQGVRDYDFRESVYAIMPGRKDAASGMGDLPPPEDWPYLKRVFYIGDGLQAGMYPLHILKERASEISQEACAARAVTVSPHDVVLIQYTSGTTSMPKGVMLSHYNIVNNGYGIGENLNYSPQDRLCLSVPLFHCYGSVIGVMACVCYGVTMVLVEFFSPVTVMRTVAEERCTSLYGVPSMYQTLLHHRARPSYDLSSLRTGVLAGSACPPELVHRIMEELPLPELSMCYGLTETSPVMTQTSMKDPKVCRVESVGRALPGVEVVVLDPQTGMALPCGEAGEVCCRGYNVMLGYYNSPEKTSEVLDGNGWLHSGDLGVLDENGYLRIAGRLKDMIIRAGENISPLEVEGFLLGMPGVQDVQVVAVPSHRYGEEVGAFFLLEAGRTLRAEDVRAFCRKRLAWYKVPRHIAVLEKFPLTASGKVQKHKLREMAAELFIAK